ncbi:MAG: chemotaxis protein CheB [Pseudomonadota bacterium]
MKKTLLIASRSPMSRMRLKQYMLKQNDFEVSGTCSNLSELQSQVEDKDPDLVLVSQELCDARDFALTCAFFETNDVRWMAFTDPGSSFGGSSAGLKADLFAADISTTTDDLIDRMRSVSLASRRRAPAPISVASSATPRSGPQKLVLIGASTGGVDALIQILAAYPVDCPPTAIVQHTGRGFGSSLVRLLNQRSAAKVVAAQNGMEIETGMVCVAAGEDWHLKLGPGRQPTCKLAPGPSVSGHIPSVDALFESALPAASNVVAVILTGMGRDGGAGITKLKQSGSQTIGQDEASCVVYGMPRVAKEMGGVHRELPIKNIASEILRLSSEGKTARGGMHAR